MGFKCCVPACKSGYKSNDERSSTSVSFHAFPSDEKYKELWIKAIPRKDCVFGKYSRVCSKHFYYSDFQHTSLDSNPTRKKKKKTLTLRLLKSTAVPSIFNNCPMYLTVAEKKERVTSKALSSSRHELEENKIEMLEKDMFESEKIGEFIDLKNLDDMILPHGFTCLKRDNFVAFLLISNADCLSISTSLKIDLNLNVIVHHNSVLMNNKIFSHILSNSGKISSVTEVANLLATIK